MLIRLYDYAYTDNFVNITRYKNDANYLHPKRRLLKTSTPSCRMRPGCRMNALQVPNGVHRFTMSAFSAILTSSRYATRHAS